MPNKPVKFLLIAIIVCCLLPMIIQAQTPGATPTPNVTNCYCPMRISGNVKNGLNEPIAGAEVEVSSPGAVTVTDAEGNYKVTALGVDYRAGCPAGDHYIFVRAAGYLDSSLFVPARCGDFTYNFSLTPNPETGLLGDVDGNSVVNILDALMVARYTVGQADPGFKENLADANRDNVINVVDALIIAQYYVGLINQLPPA